MDYKHTSAYHNTCTGIKRSSLSLYAALLLAALLLLTSCSQPGDATQNTTPTATPTPAPVGRAITSIHMVDRLHGWALTLQSVLRTSDGGAHWQNVTPTQAAPQNADRSVGTFLNATTAWVVITHDGATTTPVFHTTDGGSTWQSASISTQDIGVVQIFFVNKNTGWLLSNTGVEAGSEAVDIWRTYDGGQTWNMISSATPHNTDSRVLPFSGTKSGLGFLNTTTGWATGTTSVDNSAWLYITHDGGGAWRRQTIPLPAHASSARFALTPPTFFSEQNGILPVSILSAGASNLYFYITHDGGTTWQSTAPLPASAVISNFVDENDGWATNRSMLYMTNNSGQSWKALSPGSSFANVVQLDFISHTTGWALRSIDPDTAHILKTTDGGRTWAQVY